MFYVLIQMVIRSLVFRMIGVFDVWMWALWKVKDAHITKHTEINVCMCYNSKFGKYWSTYVYHSKVWVGYWIKIVISFNKHILTPNTSVCWMESKQCLNNQLLTKVDLDRFGKLILYVIKLHHLQAQLVILLPSESEMLMFFSYHTGENSWPNYL